MLVYKNEFIANPNGLSCQVLDTAQLDFSKAKLGRKTAETLVIKAKGGEKLETKNSSGVVESVYVAKAGDAIFVNLHNPDDTYAPGNPDGSRWKFDELSAKGYQVTGQHQASGGVLVKNMQTAPILHEAVTMPTCIKDAYGAGNHAFFIKGA